MRDLMEREYVCKELHIKLIYVLVISTLSARVLTDDESKNNI